ncbi:MAG: ABC transporter permease [Oscillatoriales cyanobacterium SM2_2_1]|nr:ABC transporter permease [Oscillatoriales cyanobacterium SM2_2_1]
MNRLNALLSYVALRLALAPVMLWAIASLVFLLLRLTPGDPVDAILGGRAPELVKEAVRSQLGLTGSWLEQYGRYLWDLVRGELGTSLSTRGERVGDLIQRFFPATAELGLYSLLIAVVVGIAVGTMAALRPNTLWDASGRLFGILTYALPLFWVGMVMQLIFAVHLGWFPIGGRFPVTLTPPNPITSLYTIDALLQGDWTRWGISLHYLCLPAITLGLVISGIFERITRIELRETLNSDYVEAAIARKITPRRILINHALRNTLIPLITIMGLTAAALLGGAILTEVTFSFPGLANRLFEAITARDYPVVQGLTLFFGAIVMIISILIDVINALIDPRIRY